MILDSFDSEEHGISYRLGMHNIYIDKYRYRYICVCVCVCVCVYVYIYIYIYTIHIHIHIHTYTGAGHIIRISSKSRFISLIPFKKVKLV